MPDKSVIASKRFLFDLERAVQYPDSAVVNVTSWTEMRISAQRLNVGNITNGEIVLKYIRQIKCHCDVQIAYWNTIRSFSTIARVKPPRYSNEYDDP